MDAFMSLVIDVDVICTSRTQVSCGRYKSYCLPACHILIRQYCWMKWPEQTLHDYIHEIGSTDMLLHTGGWQVSLSLTLVESNLTTAGPC